MIEMYGNYIGCLHSEMECSKIISLAMENIMFRLTRRLNEKEKRLIRPGYAFIYLEQESGITRWTDSKLWTPSRALGPFMMYIEKRSDTPLIKKIYSAQYDGLNVHLVIYNLLNHEENGICCNIYHSIKKGLLPDHFGIMSRCFLRRRKKNNVKKINSMNNDIYNFECDLFNNNKNYNLNDKSKKSLFLDSNLIDPAFENFNQSKPLNFKIEPSYENFGSQEGILYESINRNFSNFESNFYNFKIETDIEERKKECENKGFASNFPIDKKSCDNLYANVYKSQEDIKNLESCLSLTKNEINLTPILQFNKNEAWIAKDFEKNLPDKMINKSEEFKKQNYLNSKFQFFNHEEKFSEGFNDEKI